MKQTIHRLRHKTRKHRTFLLTILAVLLLGLLANFTSGFYTEKIVTNSFQKNFEKQSIAQLAAYSFGVHTAARSIFDSTTLTSLSLASEDTTQQAVNSKNYTTLRVIFKNQIAADNRFEDMSLLDAQGTILMAVNNLPVGNKYVGSSLSDLDYYKTTISSKKPVISDVIHSADGRDILVSTAPIFDSSGNIRAVILTSLSLNGIASNIRPPSQLDRLSYTLVDSQGNIILDQDKAANQIISIKSSEPVLRSVNLGGSGSVKSEINYLNQKVFAEGSAINIANNKFYLVNYYAQSKYDQDLAVIKSDYQRALLTSKLRSLVIFLLGSVIIFWIIKHHEAVEDE